MSRTQAAELPGLAWHRERMAAMRKRAGVRTFAPGELAAAQARGVERDEAALQAIRDELGEDRRVILLSCSSTKLDREAPAGELYCSPLFTKARELALRSGQPWAILSAKHGLLEPGELVQPYDLALGQLRAEDRRAWARKVQRQLSARWRGLATFEVFAGRLYLEALEGLEHTEPLAGLQVGERLAELNKRLAEGGAA